MEEKKNKMIVEMVKQQLSYHEGICRYPGSKGAPGQRRGKNGIEPSNKYML